MSTMNWEVVTCGGFTRSIIINRYNWSQKYIESSADFRSPLQEHEKMHVRAPKWSPRTPQKIRKAQQASESLVPGLVFILMEADELSSADSSGIIGCWKQLIQLSSRIFWSRVLRVAIITMVFGFKTPTYRVSNSKRSCSTFCFVFFFFLKFRLFFIVTLHGASAFKVKKQTTLTSLSFALFLVPSIFPLAYISTC